MGKGVGFYDGLSEKTYKEMLSTGGKGRVLLNIGRFEIGQSYVTAKVENRYGDRVGINIEGGRSGIDLQETLFRLDPATMPRHAYVVAAVNETGKLLVRKLPVLGVKDWLLIYDDDLFMLAVKDAYDELEITAV